jgi:hypothetical protein
MSYALGGWVFDTAGRPIAAATVEILSGARAGAVATTSADGSYAFGHGFPSAPEMRASKSGYRLVDAQFYAPGDTTTIHRVFRLGSLNPPIDLGGTYDLTFTADPACDALPPEARSRRYLTTVPGGDATHYALTLSGAGFVAVDERYVANMVYMSRFEDFVHLEFSDPPIWEKLASPTSLYIYGSAEGKMSGSAADFKVAGEFEFCGVTSGVECEEEVACHSRNHTLTVSRR